MSTAIKVFRGVITGLIVFTFLVAGIMKLSNKLSAKTHEQMRSDFVKFAKVHPAALYGYNIDPEKYMKQIGITEMACATFILLGPRFLKMLGCLFLSSLMIGAMYTYYMLQETYAKIAVPTGILLLLFLKLNMLLAGNVRPSEKSKAKKSD